MQTQIKEPELLVNDHHGIYIPQIFCKQFLPYIVNKDELKEEIEDCSNPENEFYWDSWDTILRGCKLTNDNGENFTIDYLPDMCDLWAIPEGYEYPEY